MLQMLGFLNTLCGPGASNLKVKDMDKYSFDPTRLVLWICSILLRTWLQDHAHGGAGAGVTEDGGLVECLATHPDLSQATMSKCASVLQMSGMSESDLLSFSQLLDKVCT